MKVGNKIHKIRELKSISPKDMADRLNMTLSGYQRIERNEVSVNIERLEEIALIFGMKPEDVLTFDEKVVFNNNESNKGNQNGSHIGDNHYHFPEEIRKLYEDKLVLQAEMIEMLKEKIKSLEVR
ncbi:MAG TPA: helix-turn-helix transcriptional regulator [Cytophagales bacterium]|nr:helix-turn-helix transcriptional regulator [Cytophagales bacterium]